MLKTFNPHKILQILYYLQNNVSGKKRYNYMYLLKLLFLAERLHIRRYGVPMSFTRYVAMKDGPVSSETKDILLSEFSFFYDMTKQEKQLLRNNVEKVNDYQRKIKKQKQNLLSKSEVEALDFSIKKFGKFDQFVLSNITHDYPEWKKVERNSNMSLYDFFDDPDLEKAEAIKFYLKKDPFEEDKDFLREMKKQCRKLYK